MSIWRLDPTFYASPKMAMDAPAEKLAYVAMVNGKDNGRHDAMGVVDVHSPLCLWRMGNGSGLAMQCDKNEYRGILSGLEGTTGKKAVDSDALTVKN